MKMKMLKSLYALSPLLLFFVIFIGAGIYFSVQEQEYAFYQVSASVAILPAIVLAMFIAKKPLAENIAIFLEGARNKHC